MILKSKIFGEKCRTVVEKNKKSLKSGIVGEGMTLLPATNTKNEKVIKEKGWKVSKLGDLLEFKNGLNYTTSDSGEEILIVGVGDFKDNFYIDETKLSTIKVNKIPDDYLMKNGDMVFVRSNGNKALIGRVLYSRDISSRVTHSGFTIRARNKSDSIRNEYCATYCSSELIKRQFMTKGGGSNINNLNQKLLSDIEMKVPPLDEQDKILTILDVWNKAIILKENLIEQKKEQKKGLMQRLLTGEVRLPGFDGEWQEVALGEITDISTGKKDNQDKVEYGEYPFFVRSENVERINSYSFDGEAILIPGDGKIGQIYHYIVGKFDYHQRVYKISDFSEISSGKFIYFYLSQFFHKEAMRYSAKATVDSLRLPMLTGMKIKLPALAEQNEIVGVLNIVDKEISLLEENLIYLKRQKQGLMQLLLTGKVRVKV
ncbi:MULTISPECIES: restriction endonuclease subunit S [unclassified Exiguobacterium]|uniref:restriction endonuclease subunit S n=2 Tax=Bacillales Family XII. Incertae Sedis TaxID=539742 RepID=UPI002034F6E9|nr:MULTISPECIES: restriction endonuclease subunit S [unclassified Exiguobacterium]MCM3280961.1 restriction endonuclease subunit S [Exiguobacterium sp. MER 193]